MANLPEPPKRERPRDRGGAPAPDGWQDVFIQALEKSYLPTQAASVAGVSRSYAYKVRKNDESFRERWEDAVEKQTELLEQIAVKRAGEGSDVLLIFLLKSRRPGVYRENVQHDHQHTVQGQIGIGLVDGRDPVEFDAAKRREAAMQLLMPDEDTIEGTAIEED